MTLAFPFPVFGVVKTSGDNTIDGATVNIVDTTNNQGTATGTSNSSGEYFINIQDYSTDGDTIKVSCSHAGEYKEETFVLDISGPAKRVDLTLEIIRVPKPTAAVGNPYMF